jgi:periplasmic divalent cation tolerance protein
VRRGGRVRIVLLTCGNLAEARRIARSVVQKRLAACANIVLGPVESVYRWKDKVETAHERLLVIKTTTSKLTRLESEIKKLHGYDVPEFLTLQVSAGSRDYLAWVTSSV